MINKGISEDDILAAADRLAGYRFRQLKLYFIIGLPTETDEDIEEIVKLAHGHQRPTGKTRQRHAHYA